MVHKIIGVGNLQVEHYAHVDDYQLIDDDNLSKL